MPMTKAEFKQYGDLFRVVPQGGGFLLLDEEQFQRLQDMKASKGDGEAGSK